MNVLVANAGSSSLKLRLVGEDEGVLAAADLPSPGTAADEEALRAFAAEAGAVDTVGHRVVHGGTEVQGSVVLDGDTLGRLRRAAELAPLHNGPALAVVGALRRVLPAATHVACFDTTFHSGLPEAAA